MDPLYVVTTVFNPRRFKTRTRLYHNFAKWVKDSGAKLITAEVAFGDRPHEVTEAGNPCHLQLRTSSDLWHKERSLNLAVWKLSQLHPDWKHMCYLDADVKIMRDDWVHETVQRLQHYAILQMFGEISTFDPEHHVLYGGRSIARNFHESGTTGPTLPKTGQSGRGWPGLGWAYRRKEFDQIGGLLDVCVTGSGDTHMAGCYMGMPMLGMKEGASEGFKRAVSRYHELCERYVRRNVSFLPGLLVHYWHGKAKDRGYDKRNRAIVSHAFDPHEDLVIDSQGMYRWAEHKWELEREIRRSMEERNEDSIDV